MNDDIKIGKNAIENLTLGMYNDSKIIYREFIQNAADQIDIAIKNNLFHGEDLYIDIIIDPKKRIITIKDNATGIPNKDVKKKLADVADSDKSKENNKGFRGIGRLGGLAYCETLVFTTSYKGEGIKTIMTCNAKEFIRLIDDDNVKDSAQEVLKQIIKYDEAPCGVEEHYFIVEMVNIREDNNELLNQIEVTEYIASNAPVPYDNKFIFGSKIYEYIRVNNLVIDEYQIRINGNDVLKNYRTVLYENFSGQKKKYDEIYDIHFEEFKNENDELIAWMWYGLSAFDRQIPYKFNEMRGLRLRKHNIQIGNEDTLVSLFKEQRGNFYFVGEVHAIHNNLVPNARRDYFKESKVCNELEAHLEYYFGETLHRLYNDANKAKNAFKRQLIMNEKLEEYSAKSSQGFINKKAREALEETLISAQNENEKAQRELAKLKEKSSGKEPFEKVMKIIEEKHLKKANSQNQNHVIGIKPIEKRVSVAAKDKNTYIVDELTKLDLKQRKLISRIYGVINEVLPTEISENLIKKIQNELKK